MSIYCVRKCLSNLSGLKRGVKRPNTFYAMENPPRQKRTKTLKKSQ